MANRFTKTFAVILLINVTCWRLCAQESPLSFFYNELKSSVLTIETEQPVDVDLWYKTLIPDTYQKKKFTAEGQLSTIIPIDRPLYLHLEINGQDFKLFQAATDTTKIRIDKMQVQFAGKYANINRYLHEKQSSIEGKGSDYASGVQRYLKSNEDLSYAGLMRTLDSLHTIQEQFLQERTDKFDLPAAFVQFEENRLTYAKAFTLAQFPFLNAVYKSISGAPPENYYDYVNRFEINQRKALGLESYFNFIEYIQYRELDSAAMSKSGKERDFAFNNFKLSQTDILQADIAFYYKNFILSDLHKYLPSASQKDSLEKTYGIELMKDAYGTKKFDRFKGVEPYRKGEPVDLAMFHSLKEDNQLVNAGTGDNVKLIYLNMWFKGCKPCILNIPNQNKLVKQFEGRGVRIINLNVSESQEQLNAFLEKHEFLGEHYIISKGENYHLLKDKLAIPGFPHYFLLSADLRLMENRVGNAQNIDQKIEEYLSK